MVIINNGIRPFAANGIVCRNGTPMTFINGRFVDVAFWNNQWYPVSDARPPPPTPPHLTLSGVQGHRAMCPPTLHHSVGGPCAASPTLAHTRTQPLCAPRS